jgi:peptidoglycan/xylan/chitin deacetylase (PgdA/CDA1 family)
MQRRPAVKGLPTRPARGVDCRPSTWMYHSVSDSTAPDPHLLRVHPDRLESQLGLLRKAGIRGVSLDEALRARARGERTRLVALTFDDGYADFRERAMPLLERYGMTATVYVVSDRLGRTNDWDLDAPQLGLMTPDDVRAAAAAGHEVGSHGANHIHLTGATPEQLRQETAGSRATLEDVLQQPVRGFCFPYGDHDDAAVAAVEAAGYAYACVTNEYGGNGAFRIPRYYVGQRDDALRLITKAVRHRIRSTS